jgi:hypothetical protein
MRANLRRRLGVVIALFLGAGLAGCQETAPAPKAEALAAPVPYVKRDGVNLSDATVAVVSLDGAPEAAAKDFRDALARQLSARGVVTAEGKAARYRLRVYLSAAPDEGGASFDYVVDVFDAQRIRQARLSDSFAVKGSGDAWSLMSSEGLGQIAAACADSLAAYLSTTPDAKPAAAPALSFAE